MKTISEMRTELAAKAAEDDGFRNSLIADPKSVIAKEYGIQIPDNVEIAVHEDSSAAAHLILPPSTQLSDADLGQVAGGDAGEYARRAFGDSVTN